MSESVRHMNANKTERVCGGQNEHMTRFKIYFAKMKTQFTNKVRDTNEKQINFFKPNLNSGLVGRKAEAGREEEKFEKYLQNSDDAACNATASIASLVRLGMVGFAEVVFSCVKDNRATDDAS